jgi:hypothetical protein
MFSRNLMSFLLVILMQSLMIHENDCVIQAHVDLDYAVREQRYRDGETKLTELRGHAKSPNYGHCWMRALLLLEDGCKDLTEDVQQQLAIEFSHCFLLKSGRPTKRCESSEPAAVCTQRMQREEFSVYTEFFVHTQNICFYLQASLWQEQTENTIARLADSSDNVARQLENASELQSELIKQQNISLINQGKLMNSGEELRRTLEESKIDVQAMMIDLQKSTTEQRNLIFEVFDRVRSLQSIVMGEFTGFYSLIFYVASILIVYFLTSTSRTSSSRFPLFVVFTLNVVFEWLLAKWCVGSEQLDPVTGQLADMNVGNILI